MLRAKNQISRAQCRVKSGTPSAENGVPSKEEICKDRVVDSVHAMTVVTKAEKSFCVLAETGATGSGSELGVDDERQHDLPHAQQPRFDAGVARLLGTDAIA